MEPTASTFEFGLPLPAAIALLLLAGASLAVGFFWWRRLAALPRRRRLTLALLRASTLMLLLFMILDPLIVRWTSRPAQDYVVMLFDDSRSMAIAGHDGVTRGDRLKDAYAAARDSFERPLRDSHHLALYRFGGSPGRIAGPRDLAFEQAGSDPVGAINAAVRDLAGAHVSAVVLFSDGAVQAPAAPADVQSAIDPAIPIYTVGVDTESPWRDLELSSIGVTRTSFDKSPVSLTVQVAASGLEGRAAVVEALESGRVVASRQVEITGDPFSTRVLLEFVPRARGWSECQARVRLLPAPAADRMQPQPPEAALDRITGNNARGFVVDNRERTARILYLSGRPNWQNKFIRRALESDAQLQLSSLIRISGASRTIAFRGGGKTVNNRLFEGFDETEVQSPRYDEAVFVRIGLGPSELATGYPFQEKDLFPYDLVIWGDIEADYFSTRQMEITRDFVARRGGSFLMLGGPRAFTEGRYAGTLLEPMMPVVLHASARASNATAADTERPFRAEPAAEGLLSGVWSLDRDPARNSAAWSALPALFGVNSFAMLRIGAGEQARVTGGGGESGRPLFVAQPYGLGRCAVFATGETWQWRMRAEPDDETHERIWRQLVRSLVDPVPRPVVLRAGAEQTLGLPSHLEFLVRDEAFEKSEGLDASVQVTPPGRKALDLPTGESFEETGVYAAEFTPEATGMHLVTINALDAEGKAVASHEQAIQVEPDLREFHNAAYDPGTLQAIARRSGGEFIELGALSTLASRLPRIGAREPLRQAEHLWRWPGFFALLTTLLCTEWLLRRRYGHP